MKRLAMRAGWRASRGIGIGLAGWVCSAAFWAWPAPAQTGDPFAGLRGGRLTVWESGRSDLLNWAAIRKALVVDCPGLTVSFRLVNSQTFLKDFASAKRNGVLPDVVFVDNWYQGGPLTEQQRVVELIGGVRFAPSRGWWFLVSEGAQPETAKAFLRWLQDAPHWQPPPFSMAGLTQRDMQEIQSAALLAVAGLAGGGSTDSVMDREAARVSTLSWPPSCGHIDKMSLPVVRFVFGNGRLAYAAISVGGWSRGGKVDCGGVMQSFLVLRKGDDGWKVLLLTPNVSLERAVGFAGQFNQLHLSMLGTVAPSAPVLLSPFDGERQTRFPKQDISWKQNAPYPAAYAVESRYGDPSGEEASYRASILDFVNPGSYGEIVQMPAPFGIGKQPHRWRVWAIGNDGSVTLSEWRTVWFTN
jgi:hypothetical protein